MEELEQLEDHEPSHIINVTYFDSSHSSSYIAFRDQLSVSIHIINGPKYTKVYSRVGLHMREQTHDVLLNGTLTWIFTSYII